MTNLRRVMMKWQDGVRTATLVKSPFRPVGTVAYRISEMGIRGLIVVRNTLKLISFFIFLFNMMMLLLLITAHDNTTTHTDALSLSLTLPPSLTCRRTKQIPIIGKGLRILWFLAQILTLPLLLLLHLRIEILRSSVKSSMTEWEWWYFTISVCK